MNTKLLILVSGLMLRLMDIIFSFLPQETIGLIEVGATTI